jgi:adenylate cyclase
MGVEIERKFLVQGDGWKTSSGVLYRQGYLNRNKNRTVRVRIAGDAAFLTVKGVSVGAMRAEFEYAIPLADAEGLLTLCDGPLVEKSRHLVRVEGTLWEVDEFAGANTGLVVAEVELAAEDQPFARPEWLGQEVTHDVRYFNSNLATTPYAMWGAVAADD